jgi:hypothetical protein
MRFGKDPPPASNRKSRVRPGFFYLMNSWLVHALKLHRQNSSRSFDPRLNGS